MRSTLNFLDNQYYHASSCVLGSIRGALERDKSFNLISTCSMKESVVEIPLFLSGMVLRELRYSQQKEGDYKFSEIVFPMEVETLEYKTNSSALLLRYFFSSSIYTPTLKKACIRNSSYIGNRGIIFNNDMDLLILNTLSFANNGIIDNRLDYLGTNIYIHPKVFQENNAVCRFIQKECIKHYASKKVIPDLTTGNRKSLTPTIIIQDVSDRFFIKPAIPSEIEFSNEKLNQLLIDNLEDLVENITYGL